jgi:hypothetical protein
MPNLIKYSTTGDTLSLKKGNFFIGTGDVGKGPTEITGYWNGVDVPSGGYIIHKNKSVNGPAMWLCKDDAEFVYITNIIEGTTFTGATQSLVYYSPMNDAMVFNRNYETITTDGLVLCVDAGFTPSYPRSGTTWYDLSYSGNNATLVNGTSFSTDNDGAIVFDGVNDYVSTSISQIISGEYTLSVWHKLAPGGNSDSLNRRTLLSNASSTARIQYGNNGNGLSLLNNSVVGISLTTVAVQSTGTVNILQTGVTFNHVIRRNSSNLVQQYKNGIQLQNINTNQGTYTGTCTFNTIGSLGVVGRVFYGSMYTVLLYNRSLTDNEILQNYRSKFIVFLGENIVTNGLVSYLDAGYNGSYPTSGVTWYNAAGYVNGTLTNGPTYSSDGGGCIVFDGIDDFVTLGNFSGNFISNPSLNNGIISFSCWVYVSSSSSYYIISSGGQTVSTGVAFSYQNGSPFVTVNGIDFTATINISVSDFPLNTWINFTFLANGSNLTTYKNGVFLSSANYTSTTLTATSTTLTIGRPNNIISFTLGGKVAITSFYNIALSSTEVLQNFNAQKSRFGL